MTETCAANKAPQVALSATGAPVALSATGERHVGPAYRQEHWDIMNDLTAEARKILGKPCVPTTIDAWPPIGGDTCDECPCRFRADHHAQMAQADDGRSGSPVTMGVMLAPRRSRTRLLHPGGHLRFSRIATGREPVQVVTSAARCGHP